MAIASNSQILWTISLIITIFSLSFPTYAQYSGGTGEPNDPYQIATAKDLMLLGETPDDYDKHFILTADIDLDPNLPGRKVFGKAVIAPDVDPNKSGFQGEHFNGAFDGNGHVISYLTIRGMNSLGLFGILDSGAKISNLNLVAVDVDGEDGIGSLVGTNNGSITTSYSSGIVNGNLEVGGLAGANGLGSITASHSSSKVSGNKDIGGLVGINLSSIAASSSTGTVTGNEYVGGLVGWMSELGSITVSHSSSKVSGDKYVGGLVGDNYGSITLSYSTATVSSTATVGPEGSWWVGHIGGLVGSNAGSIATSYSTGTVNGPANVGGLVGSSGGSIAASYSTGSVSGDENVGGLVGINHGSITMSYSTDPVSGIDKVGGLVGYNHYKGDIITCFWDIETSGLSNMCGRQEDEAMGCDDSHGKITGDMQSASTFLEAGWDFVDEIANGTDDIWKISEGLDYPRLWWEKYGGGTGEPNDPYRIYTAEHLNAIGAEPNDYDKHFRLMADIDLSWYTYDRAVIAPDMNDVSWQFERIPFTGVFDGNGHTVSHLTITGKSYLGLFGQVGLEGQVKGLGVEDVNITGSYQTIGGLVGDSLGNITASYSTGTVTGYCRVGGLVGYNNYGDISASYSTCTASTTYSGNQAVGGLVGVDAGSITMCYSSGDVSGQRSVGGLVGWSYQSNITNSYSTGTVSGDQNIGGLVGKRDQDGGIMTGCFWDVETSGQSNSAGGTGLTTAEMQTAVTFLDANWDFVDEIENGTEDIWWIDEGNDYPRFWWEAD
jgi:hypothetical protein